MERWTLEDRSTGKVSLDFAAAVVKTVGADHFAYALLQAVNHSVNATHCSIFSLVDDAVSVIDVAGIDSPSEGADSARRYVDSKFYAQDPLCDIGRDKGGEGLLTLQSASNIRTAAYRSACYEPMGLKQRCSLVFPHRTAGRIAINFYRRHAYLGGELDMLQSVAPLLSDAVHQHLDVVGTGPSARRTLSCLAKWNLTKREEEVVLCALEGLSNKEIARRLDLQPSTVVTYRNRAYRRIGVGRQAELVRLLLVPDLPRAVAGVPEYSHSA
jgi:DNA-binding CsgD family transcriptional regulator